VAADLGYVPFPNALNQELIARWTEVEGWTGGG